MKKIFMFVAAIVASFMNLNLSMAALPDVGTPEKSTQILFKTRVARPTVTVNSEAVHTSAVKRGYAGYFDAGIGATMQGRSIVSVTTSHGYAFNRYLFAGGGVGLLAHADGQFFTPVYAVARFSLPEPKTTPFADVRVGFSPGRKDGSRWAMGAYFSPSVGLSFPFGDSFALSMSAAYTLQSQSTDYSYDDGYIRYFGTTVSIHHMVFLRVGFAF